MNHIYPLKGRIIRVKGTATKSYLQVLSARAKSIGFKDQMLISLSKSSGRFKDFVWGGSVF